MRNHWAIYGLAILMIVIEAIFWLLCIMVGLLVLTFVMGWWLNHGT